jgi:hypothetical protein
MSVSAISATRPPVAYQPPAPVAKPRDADGDRDGTKATAAASSSRAASGKVDTVA